MYPEHDPNASIAHDDAPDLATQPAIPAVTPYPDEILHPHVPDTAPIPDDPDATYYSTFERRVIHRPEIAATRRRDAITTKGLIIAAILAVVVASGVLFAIRGMAATPPAPHYVGWLYVSRDRHTVVWVQRVLPSHFVSGAVQFQVTVTTYDARHPGTPDSVTYTLVGFAPTDGVDYVLTWPDGKHTYTADLVLSTRLVDYDPSGAATLTLNEGAHVVRYSLAPSTDQQHAVALGGV